MLTTAFFSGKTMRKAQENLNLFEAAIHLLIKKYEMCIKRNKRVLIHLKQQDMPRSETKEKEYYRKKMFLKKSLRISNKIRKGLKKKLTTS